MKLLTVGLVLVTAAVAGCSSTAGSSGTIQNAATASASSAASSSASAGPTSSPDPVSPSPVPTEETASPVASQTDSTSTSDSPQSPALGDAHPSANNNVCAEGLQYACGDIGASGVGTVFYASATPFPCVANGVDMTSSCNFLEVAPNGWNGTLVNCSGPGSGTGLVQSSCGGIPNATSDFGSVGPGAGKGYKYCSGKNVDAAIPNASGTLIGTGYPNTSAMLTMCKSGDAAEQVRGYKGGQLTDWSLPSKDELNALYYYTGRNAIGGFATDIYWSSSQGNEYHFRAWYQFLGNGGQNDGYENDYTLGVRPVRAF